MTPSCTSTVAARSPSGVMTRRPRIAVTPGPALSGCIVPRIERKTHHAERQDHFPILAHGDVRAGEAKVGGVTDSGQVPVAELNEATVATAAGLLRPACASTRWIERMISGRPYRCVEALTAASDGVLATVGWPDIEQALAAHPRIGARLPDPGTPVDPGARPDQGAAVNQGAAVDREAAWSRQEQSGTREATPDVQAGLRAGNAAYTERFGH